MIHIALFLLLSSCCITPIYASPNYYAVLLKQEDTLGTTTSQDQCKDDIKARLEKRAFIVPLHVALAQRNNEELNQLVAQLLSRNYGNELFATTLRAEKD